MKNIILDQSDKVLTVSLNRPEIRNAFNPGMIQELTQVFTEDALSEGVHVVLIKGEGKVFSAGADLNWMKESANYTREQNLNDAKIFSSLLQNINRLPKPVICQAHGACMGGGMGLVSVCDYAVASSETMFAFSEVRLGLIPAVIGPFVAAKIGESQTRAFFLSADRLLAARAYEIGLIHQIVDQPESLHAATNEIVGSMLAASPAALASAKNFIAKIREMEFSEQHAFAAQILADLRVSPEAQEGISAFLEKRKPNW